MKHVRTKLSRSGVLVNLEVSVSYLMRTFELTDLEELCLLTLNNTSILEGFHYFLMYDVCRDVFDFEGKFV